MSWLLLLMAALYARALAPTLPPQAEMPLGSVVVRADAPPGTLPLFFLNGGRLQATYRQRGPATPDHAIGLLLAGPTREESAQSLSTAIPRGARLLRLRRDRVETMVDVSDLGDPGSNRAAVAQIAATLSSFPGIKAVRVSVRGEPIRVVLAAQFLHPSPSADLAASPAAGQMAEARVVPEVPVAPLAGKVIVINPGHGLTRFQNGRWRYQRPFYSGEVEDRLNVRFAAQVCRELRRLGATVLTTRAPEGTDEPGISGAPRWEEAAKYYLRDIGMPDWVYQPLPADFDSDIDARPLYANYVGADLLISLHNNIGPNSGTLTLFDTSNGFASESRRLAVLLQQHVVQTIRSQVEGDWRSLRAKGTDAQYGENHWAHMPSALVEIGFISRRWDRRRLTNPRFQEAVGQAVAEAVVEYFGAPRVPWTATLHPESVPPIVAPRPADPPVFVCAGDPAGSPDMAYSSALQSCLRGRAGRIAYRVVRAGDGRGTLADCLRQWESRIAPLRPSHVLLAFGRRDLEIAGAGEEPLARFRADLAEAVRRTRAMGAVPVLATTAPIDDGRFYAIHPRSRFDADGGVQSVRDEYNAVIRGVARSTRTSLVDVSLAAWKREGEWIAPAASGDTIAPAAIGRLTQLILTQTPALRDSVGDEGTGPGG